MQETAVEKTRRRSAPAAGWLLFFFLFIATVTKASAGSADPLNFIIIFCDDLGYGDLGVYGHPTILTPNLDQMAAEGQKWTNFYAAASVCTPSRAGLLTGRLPVRSGMASNERRVLFPDSDGGIPATEITIAEILKEKNYATACIGKWHLGHLSQYLPTENGFDYYFGIPYSNDMDRVPGNEFNIFLSPQSSYWNVPIMRNSVVIERPADQTTLTKRYTGEAIRFVRNHKSVPFFVYLAHNMPHIPLFASDGFMGKSKRGLYGDVVEEIDWGVGEIIKMLNEEGLAENTLLVFTSDNGPWLAFREHGGSAGLLREGKGMTWEGGMRVPAIFWWPGTIKPAVISSIGSTLDLLPTLAALSGAHAPDDRPIDGFDLQNVLMAETPGPRDMMYFYRGTELYAFRYGAYKAHFITEYAYVKERQKTYHDPPLLYNLEHDPSENYDISADHPEIVNKISELAEKHKSAMVMGKDQLAKKSTNN